MNLPYLDAAHAILRAEGIPLDAKTIAALAIRRCLIEPTGLTPTDSMRARLSVDIVEHADRSRFKRTAKGMFALTEWDLPTYSAPRFQRPRMDEDVVVFPKSKLNELIPRAGLHSVWLNAQSLLGMCRALLRSEAEEDVEVIQLVSVFIVQYRGKYLTFKRSRRLPESRLHGYYSMHFGGHLRPIDLGFFDSTMSPVEPTLATHSLERELFEELVLEGAAPKIQYRGILYDDRVPVSRQHLGIVFDVELGSDRYAIGERGYLFDSRLEPIEAIESRIDDFENWSELILQAEKEETRLRLPSGELPEAAVACGRFQVPHKQHLEYLLTAKKHCRFLWVGVVQPDPTHLAPCNDAPHRAEPWNNPLTYWERVGALDAMLSSAGLHRSEYGFVPFPFDDAGGTAAYNFVSKKLPIFITRCDDWSHAKQRLLTRLGYRVYVLFTRSGRPIQSSDLRAMIRQGDRGWRSQVSADVAKYLDENEITARIARMRGPEADPGQC